MAKRLPKKMGVILEPFAIAYAGMIECLREKDLDELRTLREACDNVTVTNCWWATFQVAGFLKPKLDAMIAGKATNQQGTGKEASAKPSV